MQKGIFLEAFIIALIIFSSGVLLGYMLEKNRVGEIISLYQESELELLDVRVQEALLNINSSNCASLFEETINFADRIYEESKLLDKYESANSISKGVVLQHKKYDLLRALLWTNSIKLKEKCKSNFRTIVYLYEYDPKSLEKISEQTAISIKLSEVKQKYGNKLILIPIAGNLNINSINYLMKNYGVESLPAVLIDERTIIDSENLYRIEELLKK
jgi:hypothetical protein